MPWGKDPLVTLTASAEGTRILGHATLCFQIALLLSDHTLLLGTLSSDPNTFLLAKYSFPFMQNKPPRVLWLWLPHCCPNIQN